MAGHYKMDHIMRRPSRPEAKIPGMSGTRTGGQSDGFSDADGEPAAGTHPSVRSRGMHRQRHMYPCAPKSRDALRDYIWFCLKHVRAYNKSWNYYEGLQGGRAGGGNPPRHHLGTPRAGNSPPASLPKRSSRIHTGLFDFEARANGTAQASAQLSPEERQRLENAPQMEPVNDLDQVKQQYKALAKANHPDINGGDAAAEERLKEINLAYDLIRRSLQSADTPTIS